MYQKKLIVWEHEAKQRKVAVEYVKLCGYEQGGDRKSRCQSGTLKLSLDEIAKQLGTSKRDLQRALSIERNLTEPMKQLLDDGVISKTVAADLIESNLRQRVLGNTNPVKLGRCFTFLNEYYGFVHGSTKFQGNQYEVSEKVFNSPSNDPCTQKELAESYGITQQTMNNYMRMTSMIPELEDLVDTGCLFLW